MNNIKNIPKCKICNKKLKFYGQSNGYTNTCSTSCSMKLKKKLGLMININEKRKRTVLKKYGVEHISYLEGIKNKKTKTMLIRYGVEWPSQTSKYLDKRKKTYKKKYGVDHFTKTKEFKKQSLNNFKNLVNQKTNSFIKIIKIIDPSINKLNKFKNPCKIIKFKCLTCLNIEQMPWETIRYRIKKFNTPCVVCSNVHKKLGGRSLKEKEVFEYIKEVYKGKIVENDRKIIKPYEIDILIPDKKLAIEFNGLYWHSTSKVNKNYHLNKLISMKKKGYKLITIFEHTWDNKKDVVKHNLKLLLDNKVLISNTTIKEIKDSEANKVHDKYNIKGKDNFDLNLALVNKKEIISVISLTNKNNIWEIKRNTLIKNIDNSLVIEYFINNYKPKSVIHKIDNLWPNENYNSFLFSKNIPPIIRSAIHDTFSYYDCGYSLFEWQNHNDKM